MKNTPKQAKGAGSSSPTSENKKSNGRGSSGVHLSPLTCLFLSLSFFSFNHVFIYLIGSWNCSVCTFLNEGGAAKCIMCESAKPPAAPAEDEWSLTGVAGKNQRKVYVPSVIFFFLLSCFLPLTFSLLFSPCLPFH